MELVIHKQRISLETMGKSEVRWVPSLPRYRPSGINRIQKDAFHNSHLFTKCINFFFLIYIFLKSSCDPETIHILIEKLARNVTCNVLKITSKSETLRLTFSSHLKYHDLPIMGAESSYTG
jgi:hypothetical protein